MLGFVIIFFIGKFYYELAQEYYKKRWLYGILGIIIYYSGTVIGTFILGTLDELINLGINWGSSYNLLLIQLISGMGSAGLCYFVFWRKWKKEDMLVKDEIQDIGS